MWGGCGDSHAKQRPPRMVAAVAQNVGERVADHCVPLKRRTGYSNRCMPSSPETQATRAPHPLGVLFFVIDEAIREMKPTEKEKRIADLEEGKSVRLRVESWWSFIFRGNSGEMQSSAPQFCVHPFPTAMEEKNRGATFGVLRDSEEQWALRYHRATCCSSTMFFTGDNPSLGDSEEQWGQEGEGERQGMRCEERERDKEQNTTWGTVFCTKDTHGKVGRVGRASPLMFCTLPTSSKEAGSAWYSVRDLLANQGRPIFYTQTRQQAKLQIWDFYLFCLSEDPSHICNF